MLATLSHFVGLCQAVPMQVFVFGNPDIEMDALPVQLVPQLQQAFPDLQFVTLDPNEDWDVPEHMVIIDTVVGIDAPRVFEGLDDFMAAPRITCHDFDAYANLKLMKKIGELDTVTILGLPPGTPKDKALSWLNTELSLLS
jgi:hypothetical protein